MLCPRKLLTTWPLSIFKGENGFRTPNMTLGKQISTLVKSPQAWFQGILWLHLTVEGGGRWKTVTSNLITSLSSGILMEVPTSTPQHARKVLIP